MQTLLGLVKNPSGLDSLSNYLGEIPEPNLLVVMTRSRDSDVLTESNWSCAIKDLGGEGDGVEIHRFGHWGCGWWEALCVHKGTEKETIAADIHEALEHYPVLNEDHHSDLEEETANRYWEELYDNKERVDYLREHRREIDFHRFGNLLACARGGFAPYTDRGYGEILGH